MHSLDSFSSTMKFAYIKPCLSLSQHYSLSPGSILIWMDSKLRCHPSCDHISCQLLSPHLFIVIFIISRCTLCARHEQKSVICFSTMENKQCYCFYFNTLLDARSLHQKQQPTRCISLSHHTQNSPRRQRTKCRVDFFFNVIVYQNPPVL